MNVFGAIVFYNPSSDILQVLLYLISYGQHLRCQCIKHRMATLLHAVLIMNAHPSKVSESDLCNSIFVICREIKFSKQNDWKRHVHK